MPSVLINRGRQIIQIVVSYQNYRLEKKTRNMFFITNNVANQYESNPI